MTHADKASDALAAAVDAMEAVGVETPRLDAEVLLAEAAGWDRARFLSDPEAEIPSSAARQFGEMVRRRLRREPVAYIVGRKGFRQIELAVDRRVLIPRPETELLVELALELRPRSVLDVGTGSGAIALAIADELPECRVTATDTSVGALEVARANAEQLGLASRVEFVEGTIPPMAEASPLMAEASTPMAKSSEAPFDLVLANLPYVAERDWAALQSEVTQWEPREALLAGPDGLDAIRALLDSDCVRTFCRIAKESANAVGQAPVTVGLEVGEGQASVVEELLQTAGFANTEVRVDLAGIERVVVGRP